MEERLRRGGGLPPRRAMEIRLLMLGRCVSGISYGARRRGRSPGPLIRRRATLFAFYFHSAFIALVKKKTNIQTDIV